MKRRHYVVIGLGSFPNDMLRYDEAEIIGTCRLLDKEGFLIYGYMTSARWSSFCWSTFPASHYYPNGDSERGPVRWRVDTLTGTAVDTIDIRPYEGDVS